jgi:hypothetical protein
MREHQSALHEDWRERDKVVAPYRNSGAATQSRLAWLFPRKSLWCFSGLLPGERS